MTDLEKDSIIGEINPFGEEVPVVHFKGCWKEHGACAIRKLIELEIFLSMCKDKVDKKEMRKVLE